MSDLKFKTSREFILQCIQFSMRIFQPKLGGRSLNSHDELTKAKCCRHFDSYLKTVPPVCWAPCIQHIIHKLEREQKITPNLFCTNDRVFHFEIAFFSFSETLWLAAAAQLISKPDTYVFFRIWLFSWFQKIFCKINFQLKNMNT